MATTSIPYKVRQAFILGSTAYNNGLFMALYDNSGHSASTTAYSTTSEVTGTGYTAGGKAISGATSGLAGSGTGTSDWTVFIDFTDVQWTSSTITATDCLLYDPNAGVGFTNVAWYVGDFGGSKSSNNGTFTIQLPSSTGGTTAIVRLA